MNGAHEYREFIKSDIWRSSDVIHDKVGEKDTFERVVISTFDHLDLSDPSNRKGLFVQAHDYMVSQGVEERDIALLLTLFERSLNLLEVIEAKRSELLTFLIQHKEEEEAAEPEDYDAEAVVQLGHEIDVLSSGSLSLALPLLEEYSSNDLSVARASKSSFAGPYVRTVLDSKRGNRRYTERLRGRLAQMLRTSPQAISAMKAWSTGKLDENGSTIGALINDMRPKVRKAVSKSDDAPDDVEPVTECPDWVYSLIDDPNLVPLARSLEPPTFELDDDKISREQRRWIYALFIFGPNDDKKKAWLRKALATEIFHCSINKVGAVTAYLSGKLLEAGKENGGERWEDVMEVMRLGGFLDEEGDGEVVELPENPDLSDNDGLLSSGAEVVSEPIADDGNPDYDNKAKRRGWRDPEARMIEKAWGKNNPLRGKRIMLMESPQLLEWQMLEKMGAEEGNVTIVERDKRSAALIQERLPQSSVVDSLAYDFLAKKAADRLKLSGKDRQWAQYGVSRKNPKSYFQVENPEPIIDVRIFGGHQERVLRMMTAPFFSPELPEDSNDKYDLVSLDTMSIFNTMKPDVVLLFKLGLLSEDSLLFTNFFAQRDDDDAHDHQLVKRLASGLAMPHEMAIDSDLYDKRSRAVSLALRSYARQGRDVNMSRSAANPFSAFSRLARSRLEHGVSENDLSAMILYMQEAGGKAGLDFGFGDESGFANSNLPYVMMCQRLQANLMRGNMGPLFDKMSDADVLREFRFVIDANPFADLHEINAETLLRMIPIFDSSPYAVISHEAWTYRDTSNMIADFMHLRDYHRAIDVSPKMMDDLRQLAYHGKVKRKKAKTLAKRSLNASAKYFQSFADQDGDMVQLRRRQISEADMEMGSEWRIGWEQKSANAIEFNIDLDIGLTGILDGLRIETQLPRSKENIRHELISRLAETDIPNEVSKMGRVMDGSYDLRSKTVIRNEHSQDQTETGVVSRNRMRIQFLVESQPPLNAASSLFYTRGDLASSIAKNILDSMESVFLGKIQEPGSISRIQLSNPPGGNEKLLK